MNPRTLSFLLAIVILILIGNVLLLIKRRERSSPSVAADSNGWKLNHLLLASFLTLFAELAFIRWIAVEVRVFAYFKNLALLLCFVGFGLGCALVGDRVRWSSAIKAFLGLLLLVRLPWSAGPMERLSENLGAG